MSNKNTFIENALKYIQKGQLDRAVREYQRALELDPRDIRLRHKLGELLARKGDRIEALKELGMVAEAFARDGFHLKAVAVYKQQLKLRPDLLDVHLKLGELYRQLSLTSEALEHYRYAVRELEAQGNFHDALAVYEKIAELAPDDLQIRIRLAEGNAAENPKRALTQLRQLATELREKRPGEELVRIYERILSLDPSDLQIYKYLSALYLQQGDLKKALARLQVCFKADATDMDTLAMLADVFEGMEQSAKAKTVLKELARLHDYNGRPEQKRLMMERVHRLDPSDEEAATYIKSLGPVAFASPHVNPPAEVSHTTAAVVGMGPISVGGVLAEVSLSAAKVLAEADAFEKQGHLDHAVGHLKGAVLREPNCFRLHDRLRELLVTSGDAEAALRVTLLLVKLAVAARDVEPAKTATSYALRLAPHDPTARMLAQRLGVNLPEGDTNRPGVVPPTTRPAAPAPTIPSHLRPAVAPIAAAPAPRPLAASTTQPLVSNRVPASVLPSVSSRAGFSSHPVSSTSPAPATASTAYVPEVDDGLVEDDDSSLAYVTVLPQNVAPLEAPPPPARPPETRLAAPPPPTTPPPLPPQAEAAVNRGDYTAAASVLMDIPMPYVSLDDRPVLPPRPTPAPEPTRQAATPSAINGVEAAIGRGDYHTAAALLTEILRRDPYNAVAQRRLKDVQVKLAEIQRPPAPDLDDDGLVDDGGDDDFDLARELAGDNDAAQSPPAATHKVPNVEMARAYLDMGLLDEALAELQGSRLDGDAMLVLGQVYLARGEGLAAVAMLEKCLLSSSLAAERVPEVLFDMANGLEMAGDEYRALETYRQVLTSHRDYRPREVRARIAVLTGRMQSMSQPSR